MIALLLLLSSSVSVFAGAPPPPPPPPFGIPVDNGAIILLVIGAAIAWRKFTAVQKTEAPAA